MAHQIRGHPQCRLVVRLVCLAAFDDDDAAVRGNDHRKRAGNIDALDRCRPGGVAKCSLEILPAFVAISLGDAGKDNQKRGNAILLEDIGELPLDPLRLARNHNDKLRSRDIGLDHCLPFGVIKIETVRPELRQPLARPPDRHERAGSGQLLANRLFEALSPSQQPRNERVRRNAGNVVGERSQQQDRRLVSKDDLVSMPQVEPPAEPP